MTKIPMRIRRRRRQAIVLIATPAAAVATAESLLLVGQEPLYIILKPGRSQGQ